ncbi:DUF4184 family protein [Thermocatellispora tengchongensis]|uniref:DUF4184 family protein n=1 Tax=Thermocatellispora tengchongensis TaxID=1073253 RepID=UPI0036286A63
MPFTVSHVAAVIPLIGAARVRRLAEPWALAAGAMVPDLPLFLPLGEYREWHSPAGIALRCLPAGLVLLALFQYVLRDPLTALLPPPLAARVAALERPGWRRAPAMAAGVLAGAVTHVLWDSFTHSWGWAWLSAPVAGTLPAYKLAQYASTAGGLAVVAWWCGRGLTAVAPVPRAPRCPRRYAVA